MRQHEYKEAIDTLVRLADGKPDLIAPVGHTEKGGTDLAKFCWAFIREYHQQFSEEVKTEGLGPRR